MGRRAFQRQFTALEGLGPIFNQRRCVSCHDLPTSGGFGAEPITKVSDYDPLHGCDPLAVEGGDLLQVSITEVFRELGGSPEQRPEGATATVDIFPPAIFGLGLVEAVPDEAILALADPDDLDGNGVRGRIGTTREGDLARFGLKATHATLREFVEDAIRLEMGLTTPARPVEELPNGAAFPAGADPASEPEVTDSLVSLLTDYVRFLAPPARRLPSSREEKERVREGEGLFREIGCESCHVPQLVTGPASDGGPTVPSPGLANRSFLPYSDFLLHDMGPELADVCAPGVSPSEWRTTPLMGVGLRLRYLHDGRAWSLEDAILLHGGEAIAARDRFAALNALGRDLIAAFLNSL